jgi:hypothetical protein
VSRTVSEPLQRDQLAVRKRTAHSLDRLKSLSRGQPNRASLRIASP